MNISGFTFGHNLIDSGYPIIEAIDAIQDYTTEIVFVDMQSTDNTRQVVEKMGCRVIEGEWGNKAGETLAKAHALHCQCTYDTILHFEADEVFDCRLISEITQWLIPRGVYNISVWRLQVEQNFQRVRWYPELVHRVFRKGTVRKDGHTTDFAHNSPGAINAISTSFGYLWDCTNCFRDNWLNRVNKQAELWNEEPKYRHVPPHFQHSVLVDNVDRFLSQPHWTFDASPLALPEGLQNLVGVTKYSDSEWYRRMMG